MAESEMRADGASIASQSAASKAAAPGATPMMAQYLEIKSANADSLLF
jgi:hypothetical protein